MQAVLAFEHWYDPWFFTLFLTSSVMGCLLNYSIYRCTMVTSALTVVVTGCAKNVLSTYCGMVVGGDYRFTWANFVGINISMIGSLYYAFVKFHAKQNNAKAHQTAVKSDAKGVVEV